MLFFFRIDVDIKLLLEFKDSFGKFCPVFPKNSQKLKCKNCRFLTQILGEKCNKRSIFLSFFDLETQNLKNRSITETILEI